MPPLARLGDKQCQQQTTRVTVARKLRPRLHGWVGTPRRFGMGVVLGQAPRPSRTQGHATQTVQPRLGGTPRRFGLSFTHI